MLSEATAEVRIPKAFGTSGSAAPEINVLVRNNWCGTSNVVKTLGPSKKVYTPSLGRERAAYRLCLPAGTVKPPNLFMANKNALRAVLRPGGRLNLWCAVDCARGWPGGYGHPDPSHCLPGAHRSPDRLPTRQRKASPGVILFVSQQASPLSSANCDLNYCYRRRWCMRSTRHPIRSSSVTSGGLPREST